MGIGASDPAHAISTGVSKTAMAVTEIAKRMERLPGK
jgi:hypothetical protein